MFPYSTLSNHNTDGSDARCIHANPHAEASLGGYSQGVEGAQPLEGVRSYLRDLVVAQVSVVEGGSQRRDENRQKTVAIFRSRWLGVDRSGDAKTPSKLLIFLDLWAEPCSTPLNTLDAVNRIHGPPHRITAKPVCAYETVNATVNEEQRDRK